MDSRCERTAGPSAPFPPSAETPVGMTNLFITCHPDQAQRSGAICVYSLYINWRNALVAGFDGGLLGSLAGHANAVEPRNFNGSPGVNDVQTDAGDTAGAHAEHVSGLRR
jgi:hypothetical protein